MSGPRGPSVQGWVLPHLIRWVEEQGADASAIRNLRGMADLSDPDLRVPEASVDAAWRLAAALTNDDAVGVHVAESLPRGALDLVEYAFRSSASLGAGLERLVRYGHVVSDRVAVRLDAFGDSLFLQFRDAGTTPIHRGRAEFALAAALKLARDSTGRTITPQQVCFVDPAPADDSEYTRFFQVSVAFGSGSTSMILSAEDAARPLLGADDALSAVVRRRLDKTLTDRRQSKAGPLGDRVRRLMVEHLGSTSVTPATVARALAVSRRTLSRKLADEGTSFRDILDSVRRESACALLHDHTLSVADVAFFLQYSEPAAFHRAFRRWTDQTPRDFRTAVLQRIG
jgi:AraC-like DNA-binding protein